jgi:hypothetical protein
MIDLISAHKIIDLLHVFLGKPLSKSDYQWALERAFEVKVAVPHAGKRARLRFEIINIDGPNRRLVCMPDE